MRGGAPTHEARSNAPRNKASAAQKLKAAVSRQVQPPKLTASFVAGVQRRPVTRASAAKRDSKASAMLAALLHDAASVDDAVAAAEAAATEATEAAACVRAAAMAAASGMSGTQPTISIASSIPPRNATCKRRGGSAIALVLSKACGAVARAVAARDAVHETAAAAARATGARERVQSYQSAWQSEIDASGVTGSWKNANGERQVGERVLVGHKLKQLVRSCGVALSEEAYASSFAEMGGVGSTCDYETFMRFVCEHDASPSATAHKRRYETQQQHAAVRVAGGSPASNGSPGTPARRAQRARSSPLSAANGRSRSRSAVAPISWHEFLEMLDGPAGSDSLPDEAAWALFLRCGASKEARTIDRRSFAQAAAADEQRRGKARQKERPLGPLEA